MNDKEKLRFFVATWSTNTHKSFTDICELLEKQLLPDELIEVGERFDNCDAYDRGKFDHGLGGTLPAMQANPYIFDTDNWWFWYAGYYCDL